MGWLQLFSSKSQTSLKAGSVFFYSLFVTLLNYLEKQRRQQILRRRTVLAYLPVSFWRENVYEPSEGTFAAGSTGQKERFTRVKILQALHESVGFALNELVQCAMSGFECASSGGKKCFLISCYYHILLIFQNVKICLP